MGGFFVSALHKSSGKTSVSIGIAASLKARGYKIQTFKKGPDYIDALWLTSASGRSCRNLDFHTMSPDFIKEYFHTYEKYSHVSLVEGNKGLFDGVSVEGTDSNAALATLLDLPVVLVIDARGMTRGIAPVVQGYLGFDRNVQISSIILNQVGGARHETKLRAAIENYTDMRVIGAMGQHPEMEIPERHLGLIPANETKEASNLIQHARRIVDQAVDINSLATTLSKEEEPATLALSVTPSLPYNLRIAVANDLAFGFYYPDDLEAIRHSGATIIPFDTLRDEKLPNCDGLFIGGGFPETQASELSANVSLREDIKKCIKQGMPTYAECGGLMYLSQSLTTWSGQKFPMVGAIPGDAVMQSQPVGRGYVQLEHTGLMRWPGRGKDTKIPAHEFHYGALENLPDNLEYAYRVTRGHGIDGYHDGLIIRNALSSFSHQRNIDGNNWVERFVSYVRENSNAKH